MDSREWAIGFMARIYRRGFLAGVYGGLLSAAIVTVLSREWGVWAACGIGLAALVVFAVASVWANKAGWRAGLALEMNRPEGGPDAR